MELSLNDVLLYAECPIKYILSKGITPPTSLKAEFSIKLHKAVYFYYYSLMNNHVATADQMKQKWCSLWSKKTNLQEIMFRQKSEHSNLELKGTSMLLNFHRTSKLIPSVPIVVDHEYNIDIGRHKLTGIIELVREVDSGGKRIIEIVDFKVGEWIPDQFLTDHDIYLTAQSYAFGKLFNAKEDRLVYHFLKNGKQFYTSRDDKEYSKFEKIICSIAENIEKAIFYPAYSWGCKKCLYQLECSRLSI